MIAGRDLDQVEALGRELGASLPPHSVVWLSGDLGAGKTTLVRAILSGWGIASVGGSPTYALVHHYEGARGSAYHVDCFRVRHPDEAADLDWATLEQAELLLVEWPERGGQWVPQPTIRIELEHAGAETRRVSVA